MKSFRRITDAEGYDTDELAALRKHAMDYYYNRPHIAPSIEGRSKLQSSDVADMVEAVTAQIMPAFDGETIVEVEPASEADVEQAQTETNAVNWVVMQQNRGQYELQQAVRDALLLRNGVMKVWHDVTERVEKVRYEDVTYAQYEELQANAVMTLDGV